MTTKKAFKKMLDQLKDGKSPETLEKLGYSISTIRVLRNRYINMQKNKPGSKKISLEMMETMLKNAGWKKYPERWEPPTPEI